MAKTTVYTLQNVPDELLGRSIRRASPHAAPSCAAVRACLSTFSDLACKTEYVDLTKALSEKDRLLAEEACVGIIRDAPNALWGDGALDAMELEFDNRSSSVNKEEWSRRHNRVVRSRMRWHMYIGQEAKSADHAHDQAEVVSFGSMPLAKRWRDVVTRTLRTNGVECPELTSCTNINYVDERNSTGIGWHGDGERTIIVTLRLHKGSKNNVLCFHWVKDDVPVGNPVRITLDRGDAYIMSVKATGNDWLNKNVLTIRHAAGGFGCVSARVSTLYAQNRKRRCPPE